MGVVYEAHDHISDERIALKVAHPEAPSWRAVRRLRREVQLARRIAHPNVCRIFDLFQHRSEDPPSRLDLISMELLVGETLRNRCRRLGPLGLEEALSIFRQITEGLAAAHQLGIVHRDLKPGNVMLVTGHDGVRAVITDFGLAQQIETGMGFEKSNPNPAGVFEGTPGYMAPEQLIGDPSTPASDVYNLGVLIYETLSGRLPFTDSSASKTKIQCLTETPEPLCKLVPELPGEILSLVDRCLRHRASERFESATDVLRSLALGAPQALTSTGTVDAKVEGEAR